MYFNGYYWFWKKIQKNPENWLFFGQKNVIFSFFFFFLERKPLRKILLLFLKWPNPLLFFYFTIMFLRVYATNISMDFDIFLCFGQNMASFLDLGGIFGAFFLQNTLLVKILGQYYNFYLFYGNFSLNFGHFSYIY